MEIIEGVAVVEVVALARDGFVLVVFALMVRV